MPQPILHFVHANSYPAGTYQVFFEHLRKHYDVQALAMHAHNPRYPVSSGWPALARELIDELLVRYPVPVGFIGGFESVECRQAGLDATRRLVGRHFLQIPGGHLFPMESPTAAADAVHAMIQSLLAR